MLRTAAYLVFAAALVGDLALHMRGYATRAAAGAR